MCLVLSLEVREVSPGAEDLPLAATNLGVELEVAWISKTLFIVDVWI